MYLLSLSIAGILSLGCYIAKINNDMHKQQIQTEKKISDLVNNLNKIHSEKDKLAYELSLEKERNKMEKEFTEKLNRELEKVKNRLETFSAHPKNTMSLPRIKNEMERTFVEKQKKEIRNLSADTNALKEESFISQPLIEQTRERIASIVQNIYEQSPGRALEFLDEMVLNNDSSIRSNVVRALAKVGKPDTLEMFFMLSNDPDEKVKREIIRAAKSLDSQIKNNEISLSDEYKARINELIRKEYKTAEWIF